MRCTALRVRRSRSPISAIVASGCVRRASATRRVRPLASSAPASSSFRIASACRIPARTARFRFAVSALMLRLSSPRNSRSTPRASISATELPAPSRRKRSKISAWLFHTITPRPRRTRRFPGIPTCEKACRSSVASFCASTSSKWIRPVARESEPRAKSLPRRNARRQCCGALGATTSTARRSARSAGVPASTSVPVSPLS